MFLYFLLQMIPSICISTVMLSLSSVHSTSVCVLQHYVLWLRCDVNYWNASHPV